MASFAKERAAIDRYRKANKARMKTTFERVADLECLLDVAKALRSHNCLIHWFNSTDDVPEIWVEPDDQFKAAIVGKCIEIESRKPFGDFAQVVQHIKMNGVKIKWLETVYKGPQKVAQSGGV